MLDPFLQKDIENIEDTRLRDSILEHIKRMELQGYKDGDERISTLECELDDMEAEKYELDYENRELKEKIQDLEKQLKEEKEKNLASK